MWREFLRFEMSLRLRQPLFWITGLVLFLLGIGTVTTDFGVFMVDGSSVVARNAPMVLIHGQIVLCGLGLLVLTAFVADSGLRDFRLGTFSSFFSMPVGAGAYLGGRFLGSMLATFLVFLLPVIGFAVGVYMPWQDPGRVVPMNMGAALYGWLVWVLPNLLVFGSLFFVAAILTRKTVVIFLFAVGLVMAQDAIEILARGLNNPFLGSVLEPFGLVALDEITLYWTASEINRSLPPLSAGLIFNRLFWMASGFLAWVVAFRNFRAKPQRKKTPKQKRAKKSGPSPQACSQPRVTPNFDFSGKIHALWWQVRLEVARVIRSVPFLVFLITGMAFTIMIATVVGEIMEVGSIPQTALMVAAIGIITKLTLPIITTIYSGELVWRKPQIASSEDVLPAPNWVFVSSKTIALTIVIVAVVASGMLATVAFQLSQGYTHLEPVLYLKGGFILVYPMVFIAAAAIWLHTLAGSKYSGHLLVLLLLVALNVLPTLGYGNPILLYGKVPAYSYTAFNGYGPFLSVLTNYGVYWALVAAILSVLTALIWVRGVDVDLKRRFSLARSRFRGWTRGLVIALTMGVAIMATFIHWQGGPDNRSLGQERRLAAEYESRFSRFREAPLPTVTNVELAVDIYPEKRKAALKGHYDTMNHSDRPILELPVTLAPGFGGGISPVEGGVSLIDFAGLKPKIADEATGFFLFELDKPLEPGEAMRVDFEVAVDQTSLRDRQVNYQIVSNGSHFIDRDFLPVFGFRDEKTLVDPQLRKRFGLPPLDGDLNASDPRAGASNYLAADWVTFQATVSTTANQIALAPGHLQREWTAGDRRYFHYRAEKAPMTHMINFASAEYAVERDRHRGIELEIYYHPEHDSNIGTIMRMAKATLDYATEAFGPYPHRQLRIVEVPRYNGHLAMSLGGMITISESFGFLSRKGDIDPIGYITAHEIAHQWWNHQLVPSGAEGARMIAESLSEYTAIGVVEREYGREAVHRWLRSEEDTYLNMRKRESHRELPLGKVADQAYIHYSKGKLAFWALRHAMGERALNDLLREFLQTFRFKGPPYPTASMLLEKFHQALPERGDLLVEDWFETVTLSDNRLLNASLSQVGGTGYRVDLEFRSRKLRINEQGEEVEVPAGGEIEVGFFAGEAAMPFVVKTLKVNPGLNRARLFLDRAPKGLELDPLLKTIDRDRKDNFISLEPIGRIQDVTN